VSSIARHVSALQFGDTLRKPGVRSRPSRQDLRHGGARAWHPPHVAQNAYKTETARRRSAIDGRTTRHEGYTLSQKKRKRVEEIFGWLKTIGGVRQTRFRGLDRVRIAFTFALAAYNLVRMPKLVAKTE
jgi:Transposase DDE domain